MRVENENEHVDWRSKSLGTKGPSGATHGFIQRVRCESKDWLVPRMHHRPVGVGSVVDGIRVAQDTRLRNSPAMGRSPSELLLVRRGCCGYA